jgi:hypothetical protein
MPGARCRLFSAEEKWKDGKLCDWRGAFSFLGIDILDSNKTVFKYTPELEVFSKIQADFLLKNEMHSRNIFTFLSNEKSNGKYFCRTFFPQAEKDYSAKQTTLTLL